MAEEQKETPPGAKDGPERTDAERAEIEALLGPNVRSPVGIPKQYRPSETSGHELLRVELSDFAGPLDLLLYLIRQHDLDILNIPIAFITEKYLAMLDTMENVAIDVAGDFLVMAAELTHIKSKMLLPPKEGVPVEAEEEDDGDPRADLVRRLLEYQKYRDAAGDLSDRDQLGRDVFTREVIGDAAADDLELGPRDVSIFRLVEAMADVIARLEPEKQHEVIADTVTITERIRFILEVAEERGTDRLPFIDLFAGMESRRVVVMTFMAILEMARVKMLRIEQQPSPEAERETQPLPETPLGPPPEGDESEAETSDFDAASEQPTADVAGALDSADVATSAALEGEEPTETREDEGAGPENEAPRRVRRLAELPPLRAPEPGEIILVLTGKKLNADEEMTLFGEEDDRA